MGYRMNLPSRSAPVRLSSRLRVLSFLGMVDIEQQPAFKPAPPARQLSLKCSIRPVHPLTFRPIPQSRRDLHYEPLSRWRVEAEGYFDVGVTPYEREAVRRFDASFSNPDDVALYGSRPRRGPALSVCTGLQQRGQRDLAIKVGLMWQCGTIL